MQMADFDIDYRGDLKGLYRALEEQLSEATARSLGGLRTEDQRFAFAVENQLRDTLRFLDRLDRLFQEIIDSCNGQIDEAETERSFMEDKLARIETFIVDFQRMENIKRIIRE